MKNSNEEKLKQVGEKVMIVGVDIGKRKHYAVCMNSRGFILENSFEFSNNLASFEKFLNKLYRLQSKNNLSKILVGFEPTGHYWKNFIYHLDSKKINSVIVNPYHVKQSREIEDNAPGTTDPKAARIIANLIRMGKFSFLNLPKGVFAELRELNHLWYRLKKKLWRAINEVYCLIDVYFPEYYKAFVNLFQKTSMYVLENLFLPDEIVAHGKKKLERMIKKASKGCLGRHKAELICLLAKRSVGINEAKEIAKFRMKMLTNEINNLSVNMEEVKNRIHSKLNHIDEAKYLLSIDGIGVLTVGGFFAQIGSLDEYDNASEIIKLAGLNLVENSSGEKKGKKRISKRGRPALRTIIYRGALACIRKTKKGNYLNKELGSYYEYLSYVKKKEKMVALTAVSCKLIRIMFTLGKRMEYYLRRKAFPYIINKQGRVGRTWQEPPFEPPRYMGIGE